MSDGNRSDVQQRLAELNDNVRKASLRGAWQREGRTREPGVSPWVWHWKDILPSITEAGEIVPIDDVMRMRTIALVNPSQVLPFGTTRTFGVTIQHLNPGETTESHRHTPASIYFTIEGGGAYTTAEGEQQFMEPGDLLVQPNWTWHGSQNNGSTPALWLTAMDISLADYLDAWFREKYPGERVQPFTKADGYHLRRMGGLRSSAALEGEGPFPVKYPWRETLETLEELAAAGEGDPHDAVVLDYANPLDGGPTTATLGCRVQMLRPGEETVSHRHTGNAIYHVVRGSGHTKIGKSKTEEEVLDWGERDCFVIPPWHWHRFRNESSTEPVILFSVNDRPLLESIGLYREES